MTLPARVGRFEIRSLLGTGGMGAVYRAFDPALRREVALKVVKKKMTDEARARFLREARSCAALSHPSIVTVFELGEADGAPFIAMELVSGATLRDELRRSTLPIAEARRIVGDVARALSHAHGRGVVHRDLKPENVLLSNDGGIKLLDFGIARLLSQENSVDRRTEDAYQTEEGVAVGTPGYMAPEQLLGGNVDARCDLFALGAIYYELVAARPAFLGASSAEIAMNTLTSPPLPLPSTTEKRDEDLIFCLLSKDVSDRPRSADDVVRSLERDDEVAIATPAPEERTTETMERITVRTAFVAQPPNARPKGNRAVLLVALAATCLCVLSFFALPRFVEGAWPERDRRVRVSVRNLGSTNEAHLAPAIERIAAIELQKLDRRFRVLAGDETPNLVVRIDYAVQDGASSVDVSGRVVSIAGDELFAAPVTSADSISEALALVLPQLAVELSRDQAESSELLAEEAASMSRLGTQSREAFRVYRAAHDELYRTILIDPSPLRARFEEALRLDRDWHHARAALASIQGSITDEAKQTIAEGMACKEKPGLDVTGCTLVEVNQLMNEQKTVEALALLEPIIKRDEKDLEAVLLAMGAYYLLGRREDLAALTRRTHEAFPDLQFGSDLMSLLKQLGRADEVPALLDAWQKRAPQAEQALVERVMFDFSMGNVEDARRGSRDLLLLFGEAPHRLLIVCDLLIASGDWRGARKIADRLLTTTGLNRARGLQRGGIVAIFEGRFGAAEDFLVRALAESEPFGGQFERHQTMSTLLSLLRAKGDGASYRTRTRELIAFLEELGFSLEPIQFRYELSLAEKKCPDPQSVIPNTMPDADRATLVRSLTRAAAANGCVPCDKATSLGLSSQESYPASLIELGRCALKEENAPFAINAFRRATEYVPSSLGDIHTGRDAFSSVRAKFFLAQAFEANGESEAAKVAYEDFLHHWGHADLPLIEVDEAKRALLRLTASVQR